MPKDTTRASVRTEVQPALTPSGLRVEAHPTGMSLPHGDYRPQVNPDAQLIAKAFSTLANVGSQIAREQIVKQRKEDMALGSQARLEAGDNADRAIDTKNRSEYFMQGYDLTSGKLGAAQAAGELQAIYESNPDLYVTQAQLQNLIATRIQTDLQGVDSPEMRAAYLDAMVPFESQLTAQNAKYQGVVAHTQQVDNFSAIVDHTFSIGIDGKTPDQLVVDKAAMRELGLINGLSSDEVNTVLVTRIAAIAEKQGRPELLDVFDKPTQDTDNPDVTIPGLTTSKTFGPAIAEAKAEAQRARDKFEADTKEVRQNSFYKALNAQPNVSLKLKMLDKAVEDKLLTAEQAEAERSQLAKVKDSRDVSNAVNLLANSGDYAGISKLVANNNLKESEANKILDQRSAGLITFYQQNKDTVEGQQALRHLTTELVGTGRKSDVLTRELSPSPDNGPAFINAINTATALEGASQSGKAVVAKHMSEDMKNMRMIYDSEIANGTPQPEAYQLARSYGTKEAIETGKKLVPVKAANDVRSTVDSELGTFDPPGFISFEYPMANSALISEQILTNVRTAVVQSGGRVNYKDKLDEEIEQFQATHTAYKPSGSDVGVWLPVAGIDQEELQDALDWYGNNLASELGYAEGAGFYPEEQPGVGWVMHTGDGFLVTRPDGNPVVFRDMSAVVEAYNDSKYPSAEEAAAAQAAAQAPYAARARGPKVSAEQLAAKRNERLEIQRRREEARQAVMAVAERNAQRSREAIAERLTPLGNQGTRRSRRGRGPKMTEPQPTEPGPAGDAETRASIQQHEGKGKPGKPGIAYNDSLGYRTVGYGTLLEDPENKGQWLSGAKQALEELGVDPQAVWDGNVKLTDEQMSSLFEKYYQRARRHAKVVVGDSQPAEVHNIVTEMVYQMGMPRVMKFKKMRAALKAGDYRKAAAEMLDSKWARQTPTRAKELAKRMRNI